MIRIHILSPGFINPNSTAFLMPLIKFKLGLQKHGFDIRIMYDLTELTIDCDYLFIDSKYFRHDWSKDFNGTLARIENLHQKVKVIWCDQGDSTGTFLGQVLPHVHRYLKAQILKDRREYMKEHYASRIWGDYYHRQYGVIDTEEYIKQPVTNEVDIEKIDVSWNSGMMNYGLLSPYIQRLRGRLPLNVLLQFSKPLALADDTRSLDVTCRMGIPYSRETMRFQRQKMKDILKRHLPTDKLSRPAYFKELTQSKICISPYGLGEITLKDFECFLTGALLLKPNMDHMKTWPHFFEKEVTYMAHDWDLDTVEQKIEWALSHKEERLYMADQGQKRYCEYTVGQNAGALFIEHFRSIVRRF